MFGSLPLTSHDQSNPRKAREPHFPLPNPASHICTPPNGLHSTRASHQLLKKAAAVRALSVAVFNHNIRKMHKIMKTNCKVLAVAFPLKKKGSCHGKPCSPQAFLYLIFCLTIYSKYQRLKYLLIIPSGQGISICSL